MALAFRSPPARGHRRIRFNLFWSPAGWICSLGAKGGSGVKDHSAGTMLCRLSDQPCTIGNSEVDYLGCAFANDDLLPVDEGEGGVWSRLGVLNKVAVHD